MAPQGLNASFICDFINALNQIERRTRQRPHYPELLWNRALQEACRRDVARQLVSYYNAIDAQEHYAPQSVWHERRYADHRPRMNGHTGRGSGSGKKGGVTHFKVGFNTLLNGQRYNREDQIMSCREKSVAMIKAAPHL